MVKSMTKYFYLTTILLITSTCIGCEKLEDDKFSFSPLAYNGEDIRFDGFYFYSWENNPKSYDILFFYKNGVVHYMTITEKTNLTDEILSSIQYTNSNSRLREYRWGVYKIEDGKLYYERMFFGELRDIIMIYSTEIKNESNFICTSRQRVNGREFELLNENFQFMEFHQKPDSIKSTLK